MIVMTAHGVSIQYTSAFSVCSLNTLRGTHSLQRCVVESEREYTLNGMCGGPRQTVAAQHRVERREAREHILCSHSLLHTRKHTHTHTHLVFLLEDRHENESCHHQNPNNGGHVHEELLDTEASFRRSFRERRQRFTTNNPTGCSSAIPGISHCA